MSSSRNIITTLVFISWIVWSLIATVLFTEAKADLSLIAIYLLYMVCGGALLSLARKDLLSPPGLFALATFLAFGLNIPLIYIGNRNIETSDLTSITITDDALFKVLVIVLVAQVAFVIGYFSNILRYVPIKLALVTSARTRKVSPVTYLVLSVIVISAAYIRMTLHLGEAGVQPTVSYAGYLQYFLYDGVLLFCSWFLAQSLRQGRFYILLGLSLMLMLAATQALLAWKGGIAQVGCVAIGLFWYQMQDPKKRSYSLLWLLILPLVAGTLIQLGNEIRFSRLGGEQLFANSSTDLIEKIAYRSQGTTRLAAVADNFGPLTFFNDFLIKDIYAEGLTTTTYIDRKLYAVEAAQSHSVGTSGPGGPYTAMGIFGVAIAYMLLGSFYKSVYKCVQMADRATDNIIAKVFYSYLIFVTLSVLSENFGIAFVKNMVAIFAQILILKNLIRHWNGPTTAQERRSAEISASIIR
jgi:hypothetical protein